MPDEPMTFNGVNGATGEYLHASVDPEAIAKIALEEKEDRSHLAALQARQRFKKGKFLGLSKRKDPNRLEEAGWGVIFARQLGEDLPKVKEKLKDLLDLRRGQAGGLYKEYAENDSYTGDELALAFAARHGQGPGRVDPEKMPYYLLIVGGPEEIPYLFQYQLASQFAVGRVHFEDDRGGLDLEAYRSYARSVASAETGGVSRPRRATFFGPRNNFDKSTQLSADLLVGPVAERMKEDQPGWEIECLLRDQATKGNLVNVFKKSDRPGLLFTASHGVGFPAGDERQRTHQGALVCQDWPGPFAGKPRLEEHFFSGSDITPELKPAGMITFHFACYGAGTPRADDFAHEAPVEELKAPSEKAFVARLPQRLLSHPEGGALAAIGQVERAWDFSFKWGRAGAQTTVFEDALFLLMKGQPVGHAMEAMTERYQQIATQLADLREKHKMGKTMDTQEVARLWTAVNDARSYAIVGDPAVRLPV